MNSPSASFSVTMRVVLDDARTISAITSVITDAGGGVIALDVVDSHADELVFDVTGTAIDEVRVTTLRATVEAVGSGRLRRSAGPTCATTRPRQP